MANRRMLSKSISVSEQANELSDFAALLFTWMIPHADDYGVIHATAKKVKYLVVPMRKQTDKQVLAALQEMQKQGLIWRFIYKDNEYIQFCTWEEHQDIHKRTTPKNPLYFDVKEDSGNFREIPGNSSLTKPNLTKENITKENITKEKYAENVSMEVKEYEKLVQAHGETAVKRMIEILDNYKGANGKKYASDYKAILNWVVGRYQEEQAKKGIKPTESPTNQLTPDQAWQEVKAKIEYAKTNPSTNKIKWSNIKIEKAVDGVGLRLLFNDKESEESKKAEFLKYYRGA